MAQSNLTLRITCQYTVSRQEIFFTYAYIHINECVTIYLWTIIAPIISKFFKENFINLS